MGHVSRGQARPKRVMQPLLMLENLVRVVRRADSREISAHPGSSGLRSNLAGEL